MPSRSKGLTDAVVTPDIRSSRRFAAFKQYDVLFRRPTSPTAPKCPMTGLAIYGLSLTSRHDPAINGLSRAGMATPGDGTGIYEVVDGPHFGWVTRRTLQPLWTELESGNTVTVRVLPYPNGRVYKNTWSSYNTHTKTVQEFFEGRGCWEARAPATPKGVCSSTTTDLMDETTDPPNQTPGNDSQQDERDVECVDSDDGDDWEDGYVDSDEYQAFDDPDEEFERCMMRDFGFNLFPPETPLPPGVLPPPNELPGFNNLMDALSQSPYTHYFPDGHHLQGSIYDGSFRRSRGECRDMDTTGTDN